MNAPAEADGVDLSYIERAIWPLVVRCDSLKFDPKNARIHPDRNKAAIKVSLSTFRQQTPIVVDSLTGEVIAGNGTLEVMRSMGHEWIAIVRSSLSGQKAVAYGIADNKSGELSEWDYEALSRLLKATDERLLGAIGFADHELEPLLAATFAEGYEETGAGSGDATDDTRTEPRKVTATAEEWRTIDAAVVGVREKHGLATDLEALVAISETYLGANP